MICLAQEVTFQPKPSGLKKCIAFGGKHLQTYLLPLRPLCQAALSCLASFELVAIISCQTPVYKSHRAQILILYELQLHIK